MSAAAETGLMPFILGMIQASPADLAKVAAHPERSAARHGLSVEVVEFFLRMWDGVR